MDLVDVFFIIPTLLSRCPPCTDNPNDVFGTFREADNQQTIPSGMADSNFPDFLLRGMLFVIEDHRQRIVEHRGGFLEGNPMLVLVGRRLPIIPLESQFHIT